MSTHRIETVIAKDGTLVLNDLPFQAGDAVEVFISEKAHKTMEEFRRSTAAIRDALGNRRHSDSAELIREDRER